MEMDVLEGLLRIHDMDASESRGRAASAKWEEVPQRGAGQLKRKISTRPPNTGSNENSLQPPPPVSSYENPIRKIDTATSDGKSLRKIATVSSDVKSLRKIATVSSDVKSL